MPAKWATAGTSVSAGQTVRQRRLAVMITSTPAARRVSSRAAKRDSACEGELAALAVRVRPTWQGPGERSEAAASSIAARSIDPKVTPAGRVRVGRMLRAGGFALSARDAPLPAGRILFMPGGRREFVFPPILQRGVSWLLFLLCWVPDACHRTRHTECGTGSSSPARMRVHALRLEWLPYRTPVVVGSRKFNF
jgi:hypothetical protein